MSSSVKSNSTRAEESDTRKDNLRRYVIENYKYFKENCSNFHSLTYLARIGAGCFVEFECIPFEAGSMQFAFKGELMKSEDERTWHHSGHKFVVKVPQMVDGIRTASLLDRFNWLKRSASNSVDRHKKAIELARKFNSLKVSKRVEIAPTNLARIIRVPEFSEEVDNFGNLIQIREQLQLGWLLFDGSHITVESFISGDFVKYLNNDGNVNQNSRANLPGAFAHWTWQTTGGQLMICDIQGVRKATKYILTDPCVHSMKSSGFERFGPTDLGEEGMLKFFQKHECNSLCKDLCLEDIRGSNQSLDEVIMLATRKNEESFIKNMRFDILSWNHVLRGNPTSNYASDSTTPSKIILSDSEDEEEESDTEKMVAVEEDRNGISVEKIETYDSEMTNEQVSDIPVVEEQKIVTSQTKSSCCKRKSKKSNEVENLQTEEENKADKSEDSSAIDKSAEQSLETEPENDVDKEEESKGTEEQEKIEKIDESKERKNPEEKEKDGVVESESKEDVGEDGKVEEKMIVEENTESAIAEEEKSVRIIKMKGNTQIEGHEAVEEEKVESTRGGESIKVELQEKSGETVEAEERSSAQEKSELDRNNEAEETREDNLQVELEQVVAETDAVERQEETESVTDIQDIKESDENSGDQEGAGSQRNGELEKSGNLCTEKDMKDENLGRNQIEKLTEGKELITKETSAPILEIENSFEEKVDDIGSNTSENNKCLIKIAGSFESEGDSSTENQDINEVDETAELFSHERRDEPQHLSLSADADLPMTVGSETGEGQPPNLKPESSRFEEEIIKEEPHVQIENSDVSQKSENEDKLTSGVDIFNQISSEDVDKSELKTGQSRSSNSEDREESKEVQVNANTVNQAEENMKEGGRNAEEEFSDEKNYLLRKPKTKKKCCCGPRKNKSEIEVKSILGEKGTTGDYVQEENESKEDIKHLSENSQDVAGDKAKKESEEDSESVIVYEATGFDVHRDKQGKSDSSITNDHDDKDESTGDKVTKEGEPQAGSEVETIDKPDDSVLKQEGEIILGKEESSGQEKDKSEVDMSEKDEHINLNDDREDAKSSLDNEKNEDAVIDNAEQIDESEDLQVHCQKSSEQATIESDFSKDPISSKDEETRNEIRSEGEEKDESLKINTKENDSKEQSEELHTEEVVNTESNRKDHESSIIPVVSGIEDIGNNEEDVKHPEPNISSIKETDSLDSEESQKNAVIKIENSELNHEENNAETRTEVVEDEACIQTSQKSTPVEQKDDKNQIEIEANVEKISSEGEVNAPQYENNVPAPTEESGGDENESENIPKLMTDEESAAAANNVERKESCGEEQEKSKEPNSDSTLTASSETVEDEIVNQEVIENHSTSSDNQNSEQISEEHKEKVKEAHDFTEKIETRFGDIEITSTSPIRLELVQENSRLDIKMHPSSKKTESAEKPDSVLTEQGDATQETQEKASKCPEEPKVEHENEQNDISNYENPTNQVERTESKPSGSEDVNDDRVNALDRILESANFLVFGNDSISYKASQASLNPSYGYGELATLLNSTSGTTECDAGKVKNSIVSTVLESNCLVFISEPYDKKSETSARQNIANKIISSERLGDFSLHLELRSFAEAFKTEVIFCRVQIENERLTIDESKAEKFVPACPDSQSSTLLIGCIEVNQTLNFVSLHKIVD